MSIATPTKNIPDDDDQPFYEPHHKVYPQKVKGTFRRAKWVVLIITLGIYYLTPFIRWDRGPGAPDQAVLIDLPGRRFYFFFVEIWPQEVYYVTGLLIMAALVLFLMNAVAGRVWCGYLCPQTVWTDLFLAIERWTEGDRRERIHNDTGKMTPQLAARKTLKHFLWLMTAWWTGGAWVLYFSDAPTLVHDLATFQAALHKHTTRQWRSKRKDRTTPRYSFAVLYDPAEALPPSDQASIKHWARIAEKLSVEVEPITRRDLPRLAEFDALFIREATSIDNHTYRFARRAAQEGMPVIDDPVSMIRCTNKVYLKELLTANAIPVPPTVVVASIDDLAAAEFVAVPASSVGEAIAHAPATRTVIHRGRVVARSTVDQTIATPGAVPAGSLEGKG